MLQRMLVGSLIMALLLGLSVTPAQAQAGMPGNPLLGVAVCVDPQGESPAQAVVLADALGFSWIRVPLNWAKIAPRVDAEPEWEALDALIAAALQTHPSVMISLYNPPAWAMQGDLPRAEAVAEMVLRLAERYAIELQAIELLPQRLISPDIATGYASLIEETMALLGKAEYNVLLIPSFVLEAPGDVDGVRVFYQVWRGASLDVVGVQLRGIGAEAGVPAQEAETIALRSYETVREVMRQAGAAEARLWLTDVTLQPGLMPEAWLADALQWINPQLYIGMVAYGCLNSLDDSHSLLTADGQRTLALEVLVDFMTQGQVTQGVALTQGD